jgi:F0F1-type ATP synthase delta subunit
MRFNSRVLAKTLFQLLKESPGQEQAAIQAFVNFCQQNNLTSRLPAVVENLTEEFAQDKKNKSFKVSFAESPSQALLADIKKYLQAPATAETALTKDDSLIGGFVAEYQGLVFDVSIKKQLEKIKSQFIN